MKFEYYKNGVKDWRWRLKGANGEVICSGESHTTKRKCLHAIWLVKASTDADVVQVVEGEKG